MLRFRSKVRRVLVLLFILQNVSQSSSQSLGVSFCKECCDDLPVVLEGEEFPVSTCHIGCQEGSCASFIFNDDKSRQSCDIGDSLFLRGNYTKLPGRLLHCSVRNNEAELTINVLVMDELDSTSKDTFPSTSFIALVSGGCIAFVAIAVLFVKYRPNTVCIKSEASPENGVNHYQVNRDRTENFKDSPSHEWETRSGRARWLNGLSSKFTLPSFTGNDTQTASSQISLRDFHTAPNVQDSDCSSETSSKQRISSFTPRSSRFINFFQFLKFKRHGVRYNRDERSRNDIQSADLESNDVEL